jgi:hypothetical protein
VYSLNFSSLLAANKWTTIVSVAALHGLFVWRKMNVLLRCVLVLGLTGTIASASPIACSDGTVTSYLAASPCAIVGGTVQLTGFSSTFGLSPDVIPVNTVTDGGVNFLFIDPSYYLGIFALNGAGSVSVQLSFYMQPSGLGSHYFVQVAGTDGEGLEPGLDATFTGGLLTTSLTETSTGTQPPGLDTLTLSVTADWSYTSSSGTLSGESAFPPDRLFGNETAVEITLPLIVSDGVPEPAPEPVSILLSASGLASLAFPALTRNRTRRH